MRKVAYDAQTIIRICKESPNMAQAARRSRLCLSTFTKIAKQLGCYRPNPLNRTISKALNKEIIQETYLSNAKYIAAPALRRLLIRYGFKEAKCQICGLTQWLGKPIPLDLHHINSNHYDNKLENLQILCPTCHAVITRSDKKTFIKDYQSMHVQRTNDTVDANQMDYKWQLISKRKLLPIICKSCGKSFLPKQKQTKYCSKECAIQHKLRCSAQQLLDKMKTFKSYTKVAKIYGVTGNAIKKRCIKLGIYDQVQPIIKQMLKDRPGLTLKGRHPSKQTRQKLSRAGKGRISPCRKPIAKVDMLTGQIIKTYPSLTSIIQDGYCQTAAGRVCMGKRKQYKGFSWKYI